MRKSVLLFMPIILMSLTGCDFLRAVAGRPSGKDIEEKRIAIMKAEEAALQHRLDSIRMVREKETADSLAALDTLNAMGVVLSGVDRVGGLLGMELDFRYYIIVGAFREADNARKLFDVALEKGYEPVLINCRNRMVAVGLVPSNKIASVWEYYRKLQAEPFCPKEAWILVNE